MSAIKGLEAQVQDLRQQVRDLEEALSRCCTHEGRSMVTGEEGSDRARLDQNQPNPFSQRSTINYYVPKTASQAEVHFFSIGGDNIRNEGIGTRAGQLVIDAGSLTPGTCVYALVIDGKHIDSKLMVLTR